jgi:hypothetical protein
MDEGLTLTPTLAIVAASIAAIILCLWLERRPHEFGKLRFPTTPFLFIAILVIVLMAAHLLTLSGAPVHHAAY